MRTSHMPPETRPRAGRLRTLAPVALDPVPAVSGVCPAAVNPDVAGMWRLLPSSCRPDIFGAVPLVMAADPGATIGVSFRHVPEARRRGCWRGRGRGVNEYRAGWRRGRTRGEDDQGAEDRERPRQTRESRHLHGCSLPAPVAMPLRTDAASFLFRGGRAPGQAAPLEWLCFAKQAGHIPCDVAVSNRSWKNSPTGIQSPWCSTFLHQAQTRRKPSK